MHPPGGEIVAQPGNGRNVDDRALALCDHDRQRVFAAEKRRFEVEVDLPVPDFLGHRHRIAGRGAADIVHQHVEALEAVDAGLHHLGDLDRHHHVGAMHRAGATLARDDAAGLLNGVGVDIDQEDAGTLPRQQRRRGLAVAPARPDRAGPRHDRHLACHAEHGRFPFCRAPRSLEQVRADWKRPAPLPHFAAAVHR
jgi:hypothetical protein